MKRTNQILVMGINHHYAPVAVRETLDPDVLIQTIQKRFYPRLITEFILLATCNRTEIYVVTSAPNKVETKFQSLFPVKKYYLYRNNEAVSHIMQVSSGLDSMILGETEILAQIRQAYKKAMERKTIGPILHQLCKDALKVGKQTRNTTKIGEGITSIAQASLLLAKNKLGNLAKKNVLLIGAGDIVARILNSLNKQGITNCTIINRTYSHADILRKKFKVQAMEFKELPALLKKSDLVISATSSHKKIITATAIKQTMKNRPFRPLCLIDLAVPRDIDENASKIPGVYLFNIDAMQTLVNKNVASRKKAVKEVQNIIAFETDKYLQWYKTREAVPVLTALTAKSGAIKNFELEKALQKLAHLNEHDKKVIATLAKRLESKLIARPVANVKVVTQNTKKDEYLTLVKMLFEL